VVVVTAAHCGDPGQTTARVSSSSHYHDGDTVYAGRWIPDPRYRKAQSDPFDIAVSGRQNTDSARTFLGQFVTLP